MALPHLQLVLPSDVALEERDDDALMLLSRAGQSRAFDVIVKRHQAKLLSVAAKLMGSTAAAKDAAQNTFVEVHRYLPRYRPEGRFRFFLFRVLLNQCRMLRRSGRRVADAIEVGEVEDAAPRPDEAVLADEKRKILDQAVQALNEKLRTVVLLRFSGDLSLNDIAEVLGVPLGTVKSRLFAGLAALRESMLEIEL